MGRNTDMVSNIIQAGVHMKVNFKTMIDMVSVSVAIQLAWSTEGNGKMINIMDMKARLELPH